MRRIGFVFATALLSLSCGDDSSSQNGPLQPLPPADGQQLATLPYTVNPGEEKYFCYTFHSPKTPSGIIEVQPIEGTIVHHMVLFHTLVPEKEGFSECPVLIKQTWLPIWGGGRNTNGIH